MFARYGGSGSHTTTPSIGSAGSASWPSISAPLATIGNTLKALLIRVAAVVATGIAFGYVWGPLVASPVGVPLAVAAGVLVAGLLNARSIMRLVRALLLDQPPDAIVGDAARAVLGSLRRANLVSGRLTNEAIAVETLEDGTMTVVDP